LQEKLIKIGAKVVQQAEDVDLPVVPRELYAAVGLHRLD
jgi:hypothetical protein